MGNCDGGETEEVPVSPPLQFLYGGTCGRVGGAVIMCRARGAELDRARVQRGRWRRIRGALRSVPSLIVR